ncbi:uncharacterized protein LOC18778956 [Prunus persica]|uniref:uncharacterized protein LOC18778956 n=1 Tax=Prunus persica TaxID=3760 RepID=UPI0002C2ACCE|nr:uncharacterized protein LOC18778956 [Prunus persica]
MLPKQVPDNCLILIGGSRGGGVRHRRLILGRKDKLIFEAVYDLELTTDHAIKHQLWVTALALGLLVILGHRELRHLFHLGVADVLYGLPTADRSSLSACGGGGGSQRKDEGKEYEEAVRAYRDR